MSVILDVYIFIAWFGSWSTSSGFGAFMIFLLWTGILVFSVVSSYIGGWFSLLMTILSFGSSLFLAPVIAIVAWVLYFFGLGDWLSCCMPSFFPNGGYFFSNSAASFIEWIVFFVWLFLRGSSLKFMLK